ncbi:MAG: amidohydrolase family protein [Bryobacterales bacterium]|nr:amidohydrolase family protein [Bryobacterales bacterium]
MAGPKGLRRGAEMQSLHVIPDGAVLIRDGVIEQVGPSRRVERLAEAQAAGEEIDATGRVVLPAFIDCYTHLTCGPFRAASGGARESAAEASMRALRGWTAQRVELEGRRRLRQFLRHGSATVAAVSGDGRDLDLDLRALRVLDKLRATGLTELVPLLAAGAPNWAAAEALATEVLPMLHGKRLANGLAVAAEWPAEALDGLVACGERLGIPAALFQTNSTAAVLEACRLRALAAVVDAADPATIAALAAAPGTAALLLPARSFYSGAGTFAPARALIDAGAGVALATGFDTVTSPTVSLPAVMAIACVRMGLTSEEALTAVTVNAAHVLGLSASAGALQYGMRADLLIADCGDYREIPLYFGMNPVALVIRGGNIVFPRIEAVATAD